MTVDELKAELSRVPSEERERLLDAAGATCMLMAAADGEVSADERARMVAALGALSSEPVDARLARFEQKLAGHDAGDVMRAIAQRIPDERHRRLALAAAVAVAHADGTLDFEEEVLVVRLAEAFALSVDDARELAGATLRR